MDPDATLSDLISCLRREDPAGAKIHALDLRSWLARGGFPPKVNHKPYLTLFGV